MNERRLHMSAFIVSVGIAALVCGCATLPYQVEQRQFKDALSSGHYDLARQKLTESLDLAPPEKKDNLDNYFTKSLFRQSWRDYKEKNWDKSFDLMTTATERATTELREDWSKERQKIAHEYARFHLDRAGAAIASKDLKTAIAEYEAAGKADNDLGTEARTAFDRYTAQREELERRLETAKSQIEKEQWEDGTTSIEYVRSEDASLDRICRELSDLLTERHYQAAVRDSRALFGKKDFAAAFKKANEALALNTGHREAQELIFQIQKAFSESVTKPLKESLEKDARPALEALAKQYDAFELAGDASRIRTVLANRTEADRNLALAQEHIAANRKESAIEPLRKACGLWPENQRLAGLHKETRIHVGKDALAVAEKADKDRFPLVCALYCLKACQVCPTEPEIQDKARAIIANAIGKIDRKAMQSAFLVDVTVNKDIETSLDASRLQDAIINALPPSSHLVAVIPAAENPSEAGTVFRITTDVQALFATTQEQAFQKNVRYVSYVAHDPNPAYIQLQADLTAAQHKMVAAQNAYQEALNTQNQAIRNQQWANASGTASDLGRALNALGAVGGGIGMEVAKNNASSANSEYQAIARRMSNTSATIPRNVYADYPYFEHRYERRGMLKAHVRILNAEGRTIAEKVITDNFQDADTTHDGYAPAGLKADPLQLPSEDDIRARFVKKLYSEATGTAKEFVDNYWQQVLTGASTVKDTDARWERLLTLAIQVPAMKGEATREIKQNISNIPSDFVERINSHFEAKK